MFPLCAPLRWRGCRSLLRWSAVLRHRDKDEWGREVVAYEHLRRLGKRRGAVIEYLLAAGMVAEVPELMRRFAGPKARPRDFRRRMLADLEAAGVVEVSGGTVILYADWYAGANPAPGGRTRRGGRRRVSSNCRPFLG